MIMSGGPIMSEPVGREPESFAAVVGDDGLMLSPDELAAHGYRPGTRLRIVPDNPIDDVDRLFDKLGDARRRKGQAELSEDEAYAFAALVKRDVRGGVAPSQREHDRLGLLERLAMTPTERVRANAAMYALWVEGQRNRAAALARQGDSDDRWPRAAADRANAAAALAVTRPGPATAPTAQEVDAFAPGTGPWPSVLSGLLTVRPGSGVY
jgi:hypothetical protein